MIFSEKKLRELAGLNEQVKTNDILTAINSIGFEVETCESFLKVSGIKFGHVVKTYKNPNSNKLTVCEIEFDDKTRTIQTAATNVKDDDYVMAFVPGSKLGDLEIKEKEMGKIISEGMLISYGELGFNDKLLPSELADGIIILDKVDLSSDPIKYFGLDDNTIDVSILSNRSDAQSYIIFAQELAAYFGINHTIDQIIKKDDNGFRSNIKISSNDDLTFLNGMEIKNNNYKISIHDIMLLLKSNMKVEKSHILNFASLALIMCGVSIRVFDLDKFSSLEITTINKDDVFYLNDGKNNISILGVNVSPEFEANDESKNVFFEFSQINERIVRDNSKKTKLVTSSSINNSRVISNGLINICYQFVCANFLNCSKLINKNNCDMLQIKFEKDYLINYAGFDITKNPLYDKAIASLEKLGFVFKDYVLCPRTRHDLKNMQNIVEEIFRFYGFNNFEPAQIENKTLIIDPINSIEKIISSLGYKQAWTYTLMSKEKNDFNPFEFKEQYDLLTFTSEEYNSIRNSIALPLLNVFDYNIKRKMEELSLFDLGMINNKKSIIIASNNKSYVEIKNDIEKIANQKFEIIELQNDYLHPNYNAGLYLGGMLVGWIGKFNPYKINSDVIFAEILEEAIYKPNNKFIEFDSNPLKERDITFNIVNNYENDLYLKRIRRIDGIFNIKFISEFIKEGTRRLTYRVLMNEKALEEFDNVDWEDKSKLMDF